MSVHLNTFFWCVICTLCFVLSSYYAAILHSAHCIDQRKQRSFLVYSNELCRRFNKLWPQQIMAHEGRVEQRTCNGMCCALKRLWLGSLVGLTRDKQPSLDVGLYMAFIFISLPSLQVPNTSAQCLRAAGKPHQVCPRNNFYLSAFHFCLPYFLQRTVY